MVGTHALPANRRHLTGTRLHHGSVNSCLPVPPNGLTDRESLPATQNRPARAAAAFSKHPTWRDPGVSDTRIARLRSGHAAPSSCAAHCGIRYCVVVYWDVLCPAAFFSGPSQPPHQPQYVGHTKLLLALPSAAQPGLRRRDDVRYGRAAMNVCPLRRMKSNRFLLTLFLKSPSQVLDRPS